MPTSSFLRPFALAAFMAATLLATHAPQALAGDDFSRATVATGPAGVIANGVMPASGATLA